ncbi:MAG TPA: branched-chain amino acid ABC transporter permease [Candidatus Acidoferrales bacterium]|nr:branched-chain amino acid ABC transporter permease [Candidatus Acidoferrales bacterium]
MDLKTAQFDTYVWEQRRASARRAVWWVLLAAAAVSPLAAPYVLSAYWVRVLTTIFMYSALASAINVIAGFTGYPAFGNVVFFGVGAYTAALAIARWGWSFGPGAVLAAAVCAGFGAIAGLPLLRLRGHYFAVATLGMNEATRALVENFGFTGGGTGVILPSLRGSIREINALFLVLMLGVLAAVVGFSYWLSRSRFGYGCRAIRYDEEAAAHCGIPTTRYKVIAWTISASFTGIVGAIYAYWFGHIEPAVVFDMNIAVKFFVMMLLGGAGTVFGPLLGAVLVEGIGVLTWSRFLTLHSAVFGLIIVAVIILLPGGLADLASHRFSWRALLRNIQENRV